MLAENLIRIFSFLARIRPLCQVRLHLFEIHITADFKQTLQMSYRVSNVSNIVDNNANNYIFFPSKHIYLTSNISFLNESISRLHKYAITKHFITFYNGKQLIDK